MSNPQIKTRPLLVCPEQLQGIAPFMANILARRDVTSLHELELKLKHLLSPSLKGLSTAVSYIDQAIDQKQRIVIVGDYDADGATSTALMVLVLRALGADVHYLVPDRFKYGYGLTEKIVDLAQQQYAPQLLITVDNGISSHAGVEQAKRYGMTVVVTDHHLTTKPAPAADAVVNPNQLGCEFASKALAGVGVAFYVLADLVTQRKKQGKSTTSLVQYLDLVALGTYADVAALDHNNRILIDYGLKHIRQGNCRAGILALLHVAGRDMHKITASDLGFALGPRLNAAGRMQSMHIGVECLLSESFEDAYPLAQQLQQLNQERRAVEAEIKQDALHILQDIQLDQTHLPSALVLFEPHWHQGVIGIVAGRLKEQFHRPSIVFAVDEDGVHIKGSARSVEGVHIRDAIERVVEQYPKLVRFFGGHAAAAGLTIAQTDFEPFKTAFEAEIAKCDPQLLQAVVWTDGELNHTDLTLDTVQTIEQFGPWGQKFPAPIFEGVFSIHQFRWLKEKHLKLSLKLTTGQYVDAIAFNAKDLFCFDEQQSQVKLVYELDKNEFQGRVSLQLKVLYLSSDTASL
ncbi:single-stranded-DNA-specific exonuclease RecJ [Acinetobacter rathckeae]|uniref:single-stranded-DNA-specific exonuclease RecJ n=1 Tax=Acinetobacter rathckeae TaxID=2605272 RepID=UPI0018A324F2|nr:single-stranded-DNA-specific exonuclease RecJ [Acinetobacter rathckeae]MBF7688965.1 single-stranded-DNA-specific exonuclease RecJ [Acinetobacter rathckeae]MBF7696364.1 single-stranded-DNA-specific exonuclease RecJ [Acinetobacter rathckeae]